MKCINCDGAIKDGDHVLRVYSVDMGATPIALHYPEDESIMLRHATCPID